MNGSRGWMTLAAIAWCGGCSRTDREMRVRVGAEFTVVERAARTPEPPPMPSTTQTLESTPISTPSTVPAPITMPTRPGLAPYPAWEGVDLDCSDIGHPVAVPGADPHGLDRDHDGVGCEGW